jgi:nitrite reductase/ring-hydroxylating ferredoxin subunit
MQTSNSNKIFHALEATHLLHDNYRKVFHLKGQDLLLLQHEGRLYLLDNICPHAGYPLHEGQIIASDLRCPMHGYLFDLQSGACTWYTEGPCRALLVYELVQQGGFVGVLL